MSGFRCDSMSDTITANNVKITEVDTTANQPGSFWCGSTSGPYVYGRAYFYAYPTFPARSEQAYKIVKALDKAKLLKLETAKQFMAAMDAVIEVL
jgi:hypothetical protein